LDCINKPQESQPTEVATRDKIFGRARK